MRVKGENINLTPTPNREEVMNMLAGVKGLTERYATMYKGISKKDAENNLKEVMAVLRAELLDPESDGIQIIDFITLKKKNRKERIGRNPKDKTKEILIPAKIGIKCDPGKAFDKELNNK